MKTTLRILPILAATPLASLAVVALPSATLDLWTFETSLPAASGPFSPEIGSGSALGYHQAGTSTTYSSPAGNGSAHSFSSNTWANGDYYQFQVGTVGFTSLAISFDQTSSSTGPKDFKFQYSTNGVSFTDFATYSVLVNAAPNSPWSTTGSPNSAYSFSYNLSSVASLLNQSAVYFRLVDNSTPSANSGTDRVDNFAVTAIPEPSTYAVFAGLAGFAAVLWRRKARGNPCPAA
jgi:hypothetical protein